MTSNECGSCGEHILHCHCEDEKEIEFVNHPDHYQGNSLEVIDIIEDFNLGFNLGNAVKYILRSGKKVKSDYIEDLEKAIWYLQREIQHYE